MWILLYLIAVLGSGGGSVAAQEPPSEAMPGTAAVASDPAAGAAESPVPAKALGLDERINKAFDPVAERWESLVLTSSPAMPIVLLLLVAGAGFFTLVFGFANFRLMPFALRVVSGKYDAVEKAGAPVVRPADVNAVDGDLVDTIRDEGESGEVSHFQALATAVS
ncbi:MAG: hypothetical protein KDA45_02110, partial [Planctomycetales bacterium]|nr:hypothetical protein [Planctomycetales bacterium]